MNLALFAALRTRVRGKGVCSAVLEFQERYNASGLIMCSEYVVEHAVISKFVTFENRLHSKAGAILRLMVVLSRVRSPVVPIH